MIKSPGFVLRKERHSNYLGWEMHTILRTQNFQSRMEILGFTWLVLEYSEGHFPHWTLLSRVTTTSCPQSASALTEHFHTQSQLRIPLGLLQTLLKGHLYVVGQPVLPTTCRLLLGWLPQGIITNTSCEWFLTFSMHGSHLEGFVKTQFLGSHPKLPVQKVWGWV